MKQNLHTHSTYCDGKSTIKEMIASAIQKNFDILGFSGHSLTDFDMSYCMSVEDTRKYIDEIVEISNFFERDPEAATAYFGQLNSSAAKTSQNRAEAFNVNAYGSSLNNTGSSSNFCVKGYKDFMYNRVLRLYLGIEQDLYSSEQAKRKVRGLWNSGCEDGIYDYIIGSTHAFKLSMEDIEERRGTVKGLEEPAIDGVKFSKDGIYIYVDYGIEAFMWASENIYRGDMSGLIDDYYRDESGIVRNTDCDIVGHFDLILKFNEDGSLIDDKSIKYKKAAENALINIFNDFKLKDRLPIFEVNTGAMAKGYRTIPYPLPDTLELIRDMGGIFIINSDCHQAKLLDYGFEETERSLIMAGLKEDRLEIASGELQIFR